MCHSYLFDDFSAIFLIGNSQISLFGHLLWTLKSPPNNADHHPDFLLIFGYFIAIFHLEIMK